MDLEIRAVQPGDLDGVLHLSPRLRFGVDISRPSDHVQSAIDGWLRESVATSGTADRAAWVAVLHQAIVGFVSVSEQAHWCGQMDGWVGELIVDENLERRGVASALMARVESWAAERGLHQVRLTTGADNTVARAFYERLGYTISEVTLTRQPPAKPRQ